MKSGKVLLGVLAGLAAGATLGILFAPDKGDSTRKKISKKSSAYAEELSEKFNEYVASITKKLKHAKDETEDLVENGMQKAKDVETSFHNRVN